MNKKTLIIVSSIILLLFVVYFFQNNEEVTTDDFIQCLAEAGLVVYASSTCPACADLAQRFGGYDAVEPIFVECSQERTRCENEMKTNFVPEIQIKGNLYQGPRDLNSLAEITNCQL